MLSAPIKNNRLTIILMLILIGLLAMVVVWIKYYQSTGPISVESDPKQAKTEGSQPSAPAANSEPTVLPSGKQTYHFSHGQDVTGPKPDSVTLEPFTPEPGQSQKVTVTDTGEIPIDSVSVEQITDNVKTLHALGRADDGSWQGAWKIDDTYNLAYALRIILKSSLKTYDETLYFR